MDIDAITAEIVDAAIKLHIAIGPGLLESVYGRLLAFELRRRGLTVYVQRKIAFEYNGFQFKSGLKVDLLVNDLVIVEIKSVMKLAPVHSKQLLTYLRLSKLQVGLLINFGEVRVKDGLHRVVNGYTPSASSPLRVNQV
ncbi:MAG TPA: GxxExxY protein [Longimicrobiales bacterium]|nr:GxxExxY protein [Longimicrobiales bacterium]